ncbi:MAG TPA: hypothetical protein DCQ43_01820 [Treponema sp.]|nr:hypothetical protein [Treponema sp.]HBD68282.1 hypothetical protein [Treponema sp.]
MKRTHFFITLSLVILTSLSIFSCGTLDNASRSSSEPKSTKTSANDLYFHKDNIAEYLSKTFGEKIVTSGLDITSQDMTYTIRDGELQSIILGEWNRRYMFHGVKVGDSITDAHAKLKTGFTPVSKNTGKELAVYADVNTPHYLLELDIDETGHIYLIKYVLSSLVK